MRSGRPRFFFFITTEIVFFVFAVMGFQHAFATVGAVLLTLTIVMPGNVRIPRC